MGDFPSGQRGQTVNLLATPSVVRIHHPPPKAHCESDALLFYSMLDIFQPPYCRRPRATALAGLLQAVHFNTIHIRKENRISRTVSAGVGERLQYTAHKYNGNTIRFVLHYPGFLSADILCAATRAVIDRIDVLHASFLANRWRSCWQIHTDCQTSDYFAVIACAGDLAETADRIALQPIAHRDPCQMHVTLVNRASSSSVVVRVSHLVADGCDAKYLLGKLAEAYRLIGQMGTAAGLDVKNGSRSATLAYKHIGDRKLSTFIKTPFTGVKTSYPFANPNTHGARSILSCLIPASTIGKAREKAKAEHATVNDLLLTALYRSYAQITGENGTISIYSMMDLRQR